MSTAFDGMVTGGPWRCTLSSRNAVRCELVGEDVVEIGPPPLAQGEQVVGLGDGEQSQLEGLQELLPRSRVAPGLRGDRLDRRERVLHPMVELVQQDLVAFLGLAPVGDLHRHPDQALGSVRIGDHVAAHVDPMHGAVRPAATVLDVELPLGFDRLLHLRSLVLHVVRVNRTRRDRRRRTAPPDGGRNSPCRSRSRRTRACSAPAPRCRDARPRARGAGAPRTSRGSRSRSGRG